MQISQHRVTNIVALLQAGAIITTVFSIATIFDQLHRYLELFSHFRLQYLLVSIIMATILFALRNRNYAVLMLVVAVVNSVPVVTWYVGASVPTANIESRFTALLANVHSSNNDYQRLATLIADEQPDIVFLQEINKGWADTLDALAEDYPYSYVVPRNDNFGIGVISRWPFDHVDEIDSPPFGLPSLVVNVPIRNSQFTFVSTHPMHPVGKMAYAARNEQLADIAHRISGLAGPVVLIGDLNTSMWASHYRKLEADTGLRNARAGFGVLPSWPTFLPFAMIPIDHCLVSGEISVVDFRRGPNVGSDHLPLLVTLERL